MRKERERRDVEGGERRGERVVEIENERTKRDIPPASYIPPCPGIQRLQ